MRRALALARLGEGLVEPNPMVGAVLLDDRQQLIAEGWHERFGAAHAEAAALKRAGPRARGATLFVTLEPCCHQGKTPPCTEAIIAAGVRTVVVAHRDPFPAVNGQGLARLRAAGVEVQTGLLESEAARLIAPFAKLVLAGMPYVHAKWAMTLDGRIASRLGRSRWISSPASRAAAHRLRGRMDAVAVGLKTVLADDPLLTARPRGPRTPTRVIIDSLALLPLESRLVASIDQGPVLVAATQAAPDQRVAGLRRRGVEVFVGPAVEGPHGPRVDLSSLLRDLGRRQFTNVLVEGGGRLLGSLHDGGLIDELHVFIAPKLLGGELARCAVAGQGADQPPELPSLVDPIVERLEGDVYIHGALARQTAAEPAAAGAARAF